jgi:hypothetical protein
VPSARGEPLLRWIDVLRLESTEDTEAMAAFPAAASTLFLVRSSVLLSSRDLPALDPLLGRSDSATPVCKETLFERLDLSHQKLMFLTFTRKILRSFLCCDS